MKKHLIHQDISLLKALNYINSLGSEPLVLFVLDDEQRMVGTLTDGDSRRALIAGASVNDKVEKIMHRDFNYVKVEDVDDVRAIQRQKELKIKLVPVLDSDKHIVDIINLEKYKTRLPIDAVLMAGGKGERLRPLTDMTPKPLLKVGEKCIIDHNVDRLIYFGIQHITVTVNYLKEQLEAHFAFPRQDVQILTCREPDFRGTIGAIKYVEHFYNDTILVMNSDLFTNIDYEDFYLHFCQHNADMSVAVIPYTVPIPYGVFNLDGCNVHGLVEKPTYDYYINAGIYLLKRSILSEIPEDTFFNATDLIEKLISEKMRVIRFPHNGIWIDIGNLQEYQKANTIVKYLEY